MSDEVFRDRELAHKMARKIEKLREGHLKFSHVCGTHEYTITKHGLRSMLPDIEVIAGPGCPVCVTPARDIDEAILLARDGVIIATFGDVIRVRGTISSLADARANGADVRIVYSPEDAVALASRNPDKEVVFFAIGFETTTPLTASTVLSSPPENFSMLISHRLIPPAMELMVGVQQMGSGNIDGFICPGHVSTIIGLEPYTVFPESYGIPTVVTGFEPLDMLAAVLMLLRQIKENNPRVENEYQRSVDNNGNVKAQKVISQVFDVVDGHWRGIGRIPKSAFKLRREFEEYDTHTKYEIEVPEGREMEPKCECHHIILGKIYPRECPLFKKVCTPQNPKGPCMVSREGTCYIAYKYGEK